MLRILYSFVVLVTSFVLWVPFAGAQDSNSGSQQPPAQSAAREAATGSPVIEQQATVPDTLPLTGAQNLTLGLPPSGHSFLLPSFGVATTVQTNPYNSGQTNSSAMVESTFLTGRLALDRSSGRSSLALDYLTGGSFSNDSNQGNSGIQSLNFCDRITLGRWSTMFGDQLSYTSQSPFGFGGLGGLNNLGVSLGTGLGVSSQFRPGFLPDQSVLIYGSPQLSNGVIGEVDYALSHRSAVTFAGSYDVLDFVDAGFQNSHSFSLQGGYNYLLDRLNSIAVFYRFSDITFSHGSQAIQDHSVQFSYARRITGRLSLQVAGGPDVQLYQAPLAGPSTIWTWAVSGALSYQYRGANIELNYSRLVTGGSGVLQGSQTGLISSSFSHNFNKDWKGSLSGGYSNNQALQQTTPNGNSVSVQAWYATAQVNRQFVRYGSLYISYGVSGQTGLADVCSLTACQANSLTHTVTLGYNWGLRPIVLE